MKRMKRAGDWMTLVEMDKVHEIKADDVFPLQTHPELQRSSRTVFKLIAYSGARAERILS
jgi:hypothetical protein